MPKTVRALALAVLIAAATALGAATAQADTRPAAPVSVAPASVSTPCMAC